MMKEQHRELWESLQKFTIGDATSTFGFKNRLARENGWALNYAERVIDEYLKFVFLAATADKMVTPSEPIDQVWHLHLVYTRSYWDDLCRDILDRPLHHGPTKGGIAEAERYEDCYARTLNLYHQNFGEPPPEDIWPSAEKRFQPRQWQWVDRSKIWLIPKLPFFKTGKILPLVSSLLVAIAALTLTGCISDPLNWYGPAFLGLYAGLLPVAIVLALLLRKWARPKGSAHELSCPYEIGFLAGGPKRALIGLVASLVSNKQIQLSSGKRTGGWIERLPSTETPSPAPNLSLLEERVLQSLPVNKKVRFKDLSASVNPVFDEIKSSLNSQGAIMTSGGRTLLQFASVLPLLILLGFGLLKFLKGFSEGKPIGYLLMLMIFTGLIAIFIASIAPRRTVKGDQTWKHLRQNRKAELKSVIAKKDPFETSVAIPLAIAILGPKILNSAEGFEESASTLLLLNQNAGKSSNGGCGAGCGSGCGGGGCGGGCGGCGG